MANERNTCVLFSYLTNNYPFDNQDTDTRLFYNNQLIKAFIFLKRVDIFMQTC